MSARDAIILELAERVAELSRNHSIWWLLVDHDTHAEFKDVLDNHRDFFEATALAHFQSLVVTTHQLLDPRSGSISLKSLLASIRASHSDLVQAMEQRIKPHQQIFDALSGIRSKVYAHRDAVLGPELVFAAADLSPNAIGACVDVLRDVMNNVFFRLLPEREEYEFYEEAMHRADMAREDGLRILRALASEQLQGTVMPNRWSAASASLHYENAARATRGREAAALRRWASRQSRWCSRSLTASTSSWKTIC